MRGAVDDISLHNRKLYVERDIYSEIVFAEQSSLLTTALPIGIQFDQFRSSAATILINLFAEEIEFDGSRIDRSRNCNKCEIEQSYM